MYPTRISRLNNNSVQCDFKVSLIHGDFESKRRIKIQEKSLENRPVLLHKHRHLRNYFNMMDHHTKIPRNTVFSPNQITRWFLPISSRKQNKLKSTLKCKTSFINKLFFRWFSSSSPIFHTRPSSSIWFNQEVCHWGGWEGSISSAHPSTPPYCRSSSHHHAPNQGLFK